MGRPSTSSPTSPIVFGRFRVWNADERFYYPPESVRLKPNGQLEVLYRGNPYTPDPDIWGECHANTIIQPVTGLKDENGKEVYVGDILSVYFPLLTTIVGGRSGGLQKIFTLRFTSRTVSP